MELSKVFNMFAATALLALCQEHFYFEILDLILNVLVIVFVTFVQLRLA